MGLDFVYVADSEIQVSQKDKMILVDSLRENVKLNDIPYFRVSTDGQVIFESRFPDMHMHTENYWIHLIVERITSLVSESGKEGKFRLSLYVPKIR